MNGPRDLRDWIDMLRRAGELVEVTQEVDPHLEITEIADRAMKGGGPALLFTNVKGSRVPVLINQFGTERRMLMALGADSLDAIGDEIADLLELRPPDGLADKVRKLGQLKSVADARPKVVRSAPCQEVVWPEPSLDLLPVLTCWPDDGGPYVTLANVITKDPVTGGRNVGMYRLQKHSATELGLHWQIHKDAAHDWTEGAGRMEVAIALGTDPTTTYCGSMPLPKHVDEYMVAGWLRDAPVEVVPAKTIDVEVPANAEIVIEGYCERGELRPEGPFGDHTGYYTPVDDFPVMHITAITSRRDPIYPTIVVGPPPCEDLWLAKATERIFLPAVRMTLPEVVDYDLPAAGTFHNCAIVSIKKRFPGHAQKVMNAIWGTGLLSLTKAVIVVDDWVDVHDYTEVVWQMGANIDPAHDILMSYGPLDQLDHAARLKAIGGKIGFDATAKWEGEGYTRGWPEVNRIPDDVKAAVDARWAELGIPLPGFAGRHTPRTPVAPGGGGGMLARLRRG
ncbi:MAG: menaquinone biosynthesis decarboxylase [Actinomycetota bacterium]